MRTGCCINSADWMASSEMANLNAEIPDDLWRRFKVAQASRGIKTVKDGVAEALEEWVAKDPNAPVLAQSSKNSTPIEVSASTLELALVISEFFITTEPKWQATAQFLKTQLETFRAENIPK